MPNCSDVASGVLAGFSGYFDENTFTLGFIFYKKILSATIEDVNYLNAPAEGSNLGFAPIAVDQVTLTPVPGGSWRFKGDVSNTISHSWSSSTTNSYGVSVTVTAGIFAAEVSTTASWKIEQTKETSKEISDEITLAWDLEGEGIAGQRVRCNATVFSASLNLNWIGTINIK